MPRLELGPPRRAGPSRKVVGEINPARSYDRARDLPRLVPLWPDEASISTRAEHLALLVRLRRALREERKRGLTGHWSYDLARHSQLLAAYRCEVAAYWAHETAQIKGLPRAG